MKIVKPPSPVGNHCHLPRLAYGFVVADDMEFGRMWTKPDRGYLALGHAIPPCGIVGLVFFERTFHEIDLVFSQAHLLRPFAP